MCEYKKVIKFFLAGQEENEIEWLNEMSKKGYHLVNVNFGIQYVFKKGEPFNYTYYIDMKENGNTEYEYKAMYSDFGLEYLDTSNGYYYFRSEEGVDTLEIINNEQGRLMGRLGIQKIVLFIVGIINLMIFGINLIQFIGMSYSYQYTVYLNLAIGLLCLGLSIKMQLKINTMKKLGTKQHYKIKMKDYSNFYGISIICAVLIILYIIMIIILH